MGDLQAQLRELIETERERFEVPGVAVAVVHEGEVVVCEGFGVRDLEAGLPMTARTMMPIGSSTKTFTAAVIASLVDDGVLGFDQPLRELIPGFRMKDPVASEQLSARDCLSHRSGLPRHDVMWYAREGFITRDDVVSALAHLEPNQPFRHTWQYNNLLFITAGHLAGRLSGGTFEDAVRGQILTPLGMTRTGFDVEELQADPDFSSPHQRDQKTSEVRRIPFAPLGIAGPAGNINSCVADLVPWVKTLLGLGVDGRDPLLSEAVLSELRTPVIPMPGGMLQGPGQSVGYGLGLMVEDHRGHRLVHHGGNIDGFASQILMRPGTGTAVAVLTNNGSSNLRDPLPYAVLDLIDGIEGEDHCGKARAMAGALRAGAQQSEGHAEDASVVALPPVRPLGDYVGTYEHPAYGQFEVGGGDDGLLFTYGRLSGTMTHRHLEVFEAHVPFAGSIMRLPAQLTHGLDGRVNALLVQLEPTVPLIRFQRQVVARPEDVEAVLGTWTLGPLAVTVRQAGARLLASIMGAAPVPLEPAGDGAFTAGQHRLELTADGELRTPLGDLVRS